MSEEPKKLGELVVIAIGARHLSTRDVVGKGDPFVAFHMDGESKRIKAEKRGGQHPNWDEEVRFTLMKNTSKKMKIQVFNEDKREHILIGDSTIDLSEVLEKSEWDSWHEIRFRNKYAGEVSLEMTFYYAEPPSSALPPQSVVESKPLPVHNPTLPPQQPGLQHSNSFGPSHSTYTPPPSNKPPVSAPSGYPPQYPPPNSQSPPPNIYPPPNSKSPPPNVYPPPNSKSPPPNVYPPSSVPPPSSNPQQLFTPQRSTSPSSSQYPPVSVSSGYPPPQSQGYPPSYPPVSSPPFSPPQSDGNLAFPIPVPTPDVSAFGGPGPYPPQFNGGYPPAPPIGGYQQAPYPPSNVYPPPAGGNIYPPPNQGYPPNPYPPNAPY